MAKKTLAPDGSTLNAYQLFHRAADHGNYRRAFAVLKAEPHLVNHMTLLEVCALSRMMSGSLSKREARYFIGTIERHMMETVRVLELARLYHKVLRKEQQQDTDHRVSPRKFLEPSRKSRERWGKARGSAHR